MHVQVVCGINEEYKPTEKIIELQNKVADAKLKMQQFADTVLHPALADIEALVSEINPTVDAAEESIPKAGE